MVRYIIKDLLTAEGNIKLLSDTSLAKAINAIKNKQSKLKTKESLTFWDKIIDFLFSTEQDIEIKEDQPYLEGKFKSEFFQ